MRMSLLYYYDTGGVHYYERHDRTFQKGKQGKFYQIVIVTACTVTKTLNKNQSIIPICKYVVAKVTLVPCAINLR